MPNISEHALLAFQDELRKHAGFADVVARNAGRLKNVGSLGGIGATVGGIGGAGVGAIKSYREARQQGASRRQALMSGAMGALPGAATGAGIGALAGGVAGGLTSRDLSGLAQREGLLGAGARLGQRQVHGFTGVLTPQELLQARGGAYGAQEAASAARAALRQSKSALPQEATGLAKLNPWHAPPGSAKDIARKSKAVALATRAENNARMAAGLTDPSMNLTSLPGIARSMGAHGVGKTLLTGAKEQLTSPGIAALTLGLPTALSAGTLLSKNEYDEQGRGKFQRLGENVGQTVSGLVAGMIPGAGLAMLPGVIGKANPMGVVSGTAGRVGGLAGKGIDRLRKRPPPTLGQPGMAPSTLEPAEGQHTPSERVMSPAAAGQQPDIGI